MSEIKSLGEFVRRLEDARRGVKQLITRYPEDLVLASIGRQLDAVREWTAGGKWPTEEQRNKLSFGVMATRVVDDVDEVLAQKIYDVSSFLRHRGEK